MSIHAAPPASTQRLYYDCLNCLFALTTGSVMRPTSAQMHRRHTLLDAKESSTMSAIHEQIRGQGGDYPSMMSVLRALGESPWDFGEHSHENADCGPHRLCLLVHVTYWVSIHSTDHSRTSAARRTAHGSRPTATGEANSRQARRGKSLQRKGALQNARDSTRQSIEDYLRCSAPWHSGLRERKAHGYLSRGINGRRSNRPKAPRYNGSR
jgi:hypothetical protein